MSSLNSVTLSGNLTRDVEMRCTPKGTAVGTVGLAVNRSWKNDAGEKQEEVAFVDLTFWGKTAEIASQWFKKGDSIIIQGRLKMDSWEDKQTGARRTKLGVVVSELIFPPTRKNDAERGAAPAAARPAGRAVNTPPDTDAPPMEGDDVPF